jgi:hypothetical protein
MKTVRPRETYAARTVEMDKKMFWTVYERGGMRRRVGELAGDDSDMMGGKGRMARSILKRALYMYFQLRSSSKIESRRRVK